ncbi:MAG: DUF5993 family protein [Solirubrobacterales bacterium]
MMAAIFIVWLAAFGLAAKGKRNLSIVVGLIALLLSLAMFRFHVNDNITLSL